MLKLILNTNLRPTEGLLYKRCRITRLNIKAFGVLGITPSGSSMYTNQTVLIQHEKARHILYRHRFTL
jgi:hypothetical protein